MTSLIRNYSGKGRDVPLIVKLAWDYADAMMAERDSRETATAPAVRLKPAKPTKGFDGMA